MTRNDIIAMVNEIWAAANLTFALKNKAVPEVTFFSKSAVAGRAWYSEHRVEFNEILALENKETFETTIGHELAHLITDQLYPKAKQHHGPEFKHVMEAMGYDPRTYHSYDVSSVTTRRVKTRFEYVCITCGKDYEVAKPTHEKMQAIASINSGVVRHSYMCKCGATIKFTGKERKFV